MASSSSANSGNRQHLVLGATVRTLGAWPAGWRHPGAHRDPAGDAAVLIDIATTAEEARLDFLFFGDWLATGQEFEYSDPYLLARVETFAAISYLSAVTSRIGLVATVNSSYAEPYAAARSAASIDVLSGGRAGVNVATGAELRSAQNFGWDNIHPLPTRIETAAEVIEILRGLWDSWEEGAFVGDAERGRLIDPAKVHSLDYIGHHRASAGPLNVVRSPQGQLPIMLPSSSEGARALAVTHADLTTVASATFAEAVASYAAVKSEAAAVGRDPDGLLLLASILPIVAPTREQAWEIYDTLVGLVQVADASSADADLPPNRTMGALAGAVGIPLKGVLLDEVVPASVTARFTENGRRLERTVFERSGRSVRGLRQLTYRHLLVAHAVAAPVIVGSPSDIADHLETWFRGRAVDGFTVLSAYLTEQFHAFTELVVPELRRRGVFREEYTGSTLREHLGLSLSQPAGVPA